MFKLLNEKDKVIGMNVVSENIELEKAGSTYDTSGFSASSVEKFNDPNGYYHILVDGVCSSYYNTFYTEAYTESNALQLFDVSVGSNSTNNDGFVPYKRIIYNNFLKYCGGSSYKSLVKKSDNKDFFPHFDNTLYISMKRNLIKDAINPSGFYLNFWGASGSQNMSSLAYVVDTDGQVKIEIDNTNTHYNKNEYGMHFDVLKIKDFSSGIYTSSFANGGSILGIVNIDAGLFIFDLDRLYHLGHLTGSNDNPFPDYLSCSSIPSGMLTGSFDDVIDKYFVSSYTGCGKFYYYNIPNRINLISCTYNCFLDSNEFNYSSNPTYIDANGLIRVVSGSAIDNPAKPCTYITGIGLYDMQDNLLAVAKLSRPVRKSFDNSLTLHIRLDY